MGHALLIDKEIIRYLAVLSEKKKKVVLSVIRSFAEEEHSLWERIPDAVRKSIMQGHKQAKSGKGKTHKEVMKKYSEWLGE